MGVSFVIRHLGHRPHGQVWADMVAFTGNRTGSSDDELWVTGHDPVYTLGLGAKPEHVLDAGVIPVVRTDRGGQVTYHGPGQLVVYVLMDIRRAGIGVRTLVKRIEQAVIDCVAELGIDAARVAGAPGVYVDGRKLAALGLRVRRGCSYHGVAVNVDGDLSPFAGINPCGFPGLPVTRLADLGVTLDCDGFAARFLPVLCRSLNGVEGKQRRGRRAGASAAGQRETAHG